MENSSGSDFINQAAMVAGHLEVEKSRRALRNGTALGCSLRPALLNQGFKAVTHRKPSGTSAWDAHTSDTGQATST